MGFLTEEDKRYILEAGERWDGKSVHDRCNDIVKRSQSNLDDMIWLFEHLDPFRQCMSREFVTKYSKDKKPPIRGDVTSEKFIKKDEMKRLLELYFKGFEDLPSLKEWIVARWGSKYTLEQYLDTPRGKEGRAQFEEAIRNLKKSFIQFIEEIEV